MERTGPGVAAICIRRSCPGWVDFLALAEGGANQLLRFSGCAEELELSCWKPKAAPRRAEMFADVVHMRFDAIYILEGKPELRERLTQAVDADFAEVLCCRACIRSAEGGRTAWSSRDHTLKVKLSFLASLSQWEPLASEEGFQEIFGDAPKDERFYDQWWTIERLECDADVEDIAGQYAAELRRMPSCLNSLVRAWVQQKVAPGELNAGGDGGPAGS